MEFDHSVSPEVFQKELFSLIDSLLPVDGLRFHIYLPELELTQKVGSDDNVNHMISEYASKHWESDPLHPSNFEDTDTRLVTNTDLMSNEAWKQSTIFEEFFEPHGFFHDADMFFRQQGKIIAVLTLLREDEQAEFAAEEVKLLNSIQPFIEYSLSQVYLPKRIVNRSSFAELYGFTSRELDVVDFALTGCSNKMLIQHLNIAMPTLRTHLQSIYSKVGVHSNAELISKLLGVLK